MCKHLVCNFRCKKYHEPLTNEVDSKYSHAQSLNKILGVKYCFNHDKRKYHIKREQVASRSPKGLTQYTNQ